MCTAPTSAIAGEATSSATWTGSPAKVGAPRSAEGRAPPPLFRLVGGVGFFSLQMRFIWIQRSPCE